MPRILESSFKTKVNKALDKIPGLFHFSLMPGSLAGLPDKFICYRGKFIGWELKRSKADANKNRQGHTLQKWVANQITEAGGIARTVYPENLEESLEELLKIS